MLGMGGSKERGLQYLRDCAEGSGETAVDAKILLVLFLRREHRYQDALPIARDLIHSYPHDVLMALEEGNLLRADGHNQEAADVYRKVWQAGQKGQYDGLHYEIAALSLGDLLRGEKDYAGAASAYEKVSQLPNPDPEILQKANLAAGEVYDLQKKRDLAVTKYQAVVNTDSKTTLAQTASRLIKQAYREE